MYEFLINYSKKGKEKEEAPKIKIPSHPRNGACPPQVVLTTPPTLQSPKPKYTFHRPSLTNRTSFRDTAGGKSQRPNEKDIDKTRQDRPHFDFHFNGFNSKHGWCHVVLQQTTHGGPQAKHKRRDPLQIVVFRWC